MSTEWVMIAYGGAALLALLVLYFFEPTRWFWHVLSLAAAAAIGFVRLPAEWTTPERTLLVGAAFLFLVMWGLAFPLFRKFHFHHRREKTA